MGEYKKGLLNGKMTQYPGDDPIQNCITKGGAIKLQHKGVSKQEAFFRHEYKLYEVDPDQDEKDLLAEFNRLKAKAQASGYAAAEFA